MCAISYLATLCMSLTQQTSDGTNEVLVGIDSDVFWNRFRIVGPEPESAPELVVKSAQESQSVPESELPSKRSRFRHLQKDRR